MATGAGSRHPSNGTGRDLANGDDELSAPDDDEASFDWTKFLGLHTPQERTLDWDDTAWEEALREAEIYESELFDSD